MSLLWQKEMKFFVLTILFLRLLVAQSVKSPLLRSQSPRTHLGRVMDIITRRQVIIQKLSGAYNKPKVLVIYNAIRRWRGGGGRRRGSDRDRHIRSVHDVPLTPVFVRPRPQRTTRGHQIRRQSQGWTEKEHRGLLRFVPSPVRPLLLVDIIWPFACRSNWNTALWNFLRDCGPRSSTAQLSAGSFIWRDRSGDVTIFGSRVRRSR